MNRSNVGLGKLIRNKSLKVIVNAITLGSFLLSSVGVDPAWAVGTSIQPARTGTAVSNSSMSIPAPSDIAVPLRYGEIKNVFSGSNGKIIIHVQDAHCNYAAQESIQNIVKHLADTYKISLISLEGGKGNYDLSILTDIKDPATREKVSDYFVREGVVNGPEFFAINNPGKVKLFGIEDEELYRGCVAIITIV